MTDIIFHDNTPQHIRDIVLLAAAEWKPRPDKRKLIQGVGINDADYMVSCNTPNGTWKCPLYSQWSSMLTRCYGKTTPTYVGCTVAPEWHSFMAFREWSLQNKWQLGYSLDKDYLSNGAKIYSPSTCAWVPKIVNSFILDNSAARGKLPIGVRRQRSGRYSGVACNPLTNKAEHIGVYPTINEAHLAWRARKNKHAHMLADMYPDLDPRLLEALRTRYSE